MNHALLSSSTVYFKRLPLCFRIDCCCLNTARLLCSSCCLIINNTNISWRQSFVSRWVGAHTGCRICKRHPSCSLLMPDRTSVERHNGELQSHFHCPKRNRESAVTQSGLRCPKRAAGRMCPLSSV